MARYDMTRLTFVYTGRPPKHRPPVAVTTLPLAVPVVTNGESEEHRAEDVSDNASHDGPLKV